MNLMIVERKNLFRFVKSLRSDYCGVSTLQQNGISCSDNQSKADFLNSQFSSVFTKDDSSSLPDMDLGLYPNIFNFVVSTSGVTKILQELDPSKSPGPDKIPSKTTQIYSYGSISLSYVIILGFFTSR